MKVNDEILSAYLDQELEAELHAKVCKEIEKSPTLQSRLQQLKRADVEATTFFRQLKQVPLSSSAQKIVDALEQNQQQNLNTGDVGSSKVVNLGQHSNKQPKIGTTPRIPTWFISMAASIVLVVGGFVWWNNFRDSGVDIQVMQQANGIIDSNNIFYDLLEKTPSGETLGKLGNKDIQGVVVLTFASTEGYPCREFTLQNAVAATRNVACRRNRDEWQVQISVAMPLTNVNNYTPASDEGIAAIDSVIDALIDGRPLNRSQEQTWLDQRWRP